MERKTRRVQAQVKNQLFEFNEIYLEDEKGNEVFDRTIWIENDINLYNQYKNKNGLLTTDEVVSIRNKYQLTQKDFALVLGLGEVSINRIENGSIQTRAIDETIRIAEHPHEFKRVLNINKDKVSNRVYSDLIKRIDQFQLDIKHKVADLSGINISGLDFKTSTAVDIAYEIVHQHNSLVFADLKKYVNTNDMSMEEVESFYSTNLLVQKLLYYVQGLSLTLFDAPAFNEQILAWEVGPVVVETYQKFKKFRAKVLKIEESRQIELSLGLKLIIKKVVASYGTMGAKKLIEFIHEEDPYIDSGLNQEITQDLMKAYFSRIYL